MNLFNEPDADDELPPRQRPQPAALQPTATLAIPAGPPDFIRCHDELGAMCGHGALAAALDISVRKACSFFPELKPERGWVNLPEMESALRRAGAGFHSTRADWPCQHGLFTTGLVIIQWLGTWLDAGVPPAAACRQTHWIATMGGLVYDVNLGEWCSLSRWEQTLDMELRRALSPRSTGWRIKRGYEVSTHNRP